MKAIFPLLVVSALILGSCGNNAKQPDGQATQQQDQGNGIDKHGEKEPKESKEKKDLKEQLASAETKLQENQQQREQQATALTTATEELNRLQNHHALGVGGGDRQAQITTATDKVNQIKTDADKLAEAGAQLETQVNELKAKLANTQ